MKAFTTLLAGAAALAACSQPATTSGSASASASASATTPATTAAPAAVSTSGAAATLPMAQRQFAYGNHVPPARITALTGVDTAHAEMSGRVTEADARAYCAGEPTDPAQPRQVETCTAGYMRDLGTTVMTAMADCTSRRLNYSGDAYTPVRPDPDYAGYLTFRSEEHAQLQENSGAGGGLVLNDLFSTLCPAAFRAAGGTELNP